VCSVVTCRTVLYRHVHTCTTGGLACASKRLQLRRCPMVFEINRNVSFKILVTPFNTAGNKQHVNRWCLDMSTDVQSYCLLVDCKVATATECVWRYAAPTASFISVSVSHRLQAPPRVNYSTVVTTDRNFSPQSTKQCIIVCRFAAVRSATRRFGSTVVSFVHLLKPFALMNHSSLQQVRSIPL